MKAVACKRNYIAEGMREGRVPTFAQLLPREGARVAGTRVHIFGKNFERGICKEKSLRCQFGSTESTAAYYISTEHLICVTPDSGITSGELAVPVKVRLDGINYLSTNLTFTYKYDVISIGQSPIVMPVNVENVKIKSKNLNKPVSFSKNKKSNKYRTDT